MTIELEFVPDVIIFFYPNNIMGQRSILGRIWGDYSIFEVIEEWVHSLVYGKGYCWFALQKSTLKYKIIDVKMEES